MANNNSRFVNHKSHEWDEGDRAVVIRYRVINSGSSWELVELIAKRGRDGLLRWREGRTLSSRRGVSYYEAVLAANDVAEESDGLVPSDGDLLIAQWRDGDLVNNRKSRIQRALKEDL